MIREAPSKLIDMTAPPVNHAPILNQLADVSLPAEPALWPTISIISMILIAIALIIYIAYCRRQSLPSATERHRTQKALERLAIVESAWSKREIDSREAAYQLSTLLRLGLNLPQLNQHSPPALINDHQAWQETLALFNQLRYQPHITRPLTCNTFEQLRLWLNRSQQTNQGGQYV